MKNLISQTFALSVILLFGIMTCSRSVDSNVSTAPRELIIRFYSEDSHTTIVMIYDSTHGRIHLMMPLTSKWGDTELSLLKDEVVRLTLSDRIVKLGDGYTFRFMGGYPQWSPFRSYGPGYEHSCLQFTENVTFDGKQISAWGDKRRSTSYYPYPDKAGRPLAKER